MSVNRRCVTDILVIANKRGVRIHMEAVLIVGGVPCGVVGDDEYVLLGFIVVETYSRLTASVALIDKVDVAYVVLLILGAMTVPCLAGNAKLPLLVLECVSAKTHSHIYAVERLAVVCPPFVGGSCLEHRRYDFHLSVSANENDSAKRSVLESSYKVVLTCDCIRPEVLVNHTEVGVCGTDCAVIVNSAVNVGPEGKLSRLDIERAHLGAVYSVLGVDKNSLLVLCPKKMCRRNAAAGLITLKTRFEAVEYALKYSTTLCNNLPFIGLIGAHFVERAAEAEVDIAVIGVNEGDSRTAHFIVDGDFVGLKVENRTNLGV